MQDSWWGSAVYGISSSSCSCKLLTYQGAPGTIRKHFDWTTWSLVSWLLAACLKQGKRLTWDVWSVYTVNPFRCDMDQHTKNSDIYDSWSENSLVSSNQTPHSDLLSRAGPGRAGPDHMFTLSHCLPIWVHNDLRTAATHIGLHLPTGLFPKGFPNKSFKNIIGSFNLVIFHFCDFFVNY